MSTNFENLWEKLARSKKYRERFAAAFAKRSIPLQIRKLMKSRDLSQEELAELSKLTQGVISRAADLNYGSLTLNTIIKIADGLDCAFVGRYVPFSELQRVAESLSDETELIVPSFEQENEEMMHTEINQSEIHLVNKKKPPAREEQAQGAGQQSDSKEKAKQRNKGGYSWFGDAVGAR